ncbi:MAG: hypothetical protein ABI972_19730 [Acidobacteriota bacterium]
MSKQADSVQYTIRDVPPEVDQALRKKAARRNISLNRLILDELAQATDQRTPRADFSDLVGRWTPDPAFDEIIAAQRKIDRKKWR